MDWSEYEEITKYIYETLGKESGVIIKGYGNSCKVLGKSGVKHQIDVLTSHSDGIHDYKTAIECKYWKDKINKDIVMKVASIIEDAGIDKGVVVSKNGFTDDGLEYAKYKNIGLVELRELSEQEIKQHTGLIHIKTFIKRPEILRTIMHFKGVEEKPDEFVRFNTSEIRLKDGDIVPFKKYILDFKKELVQEREFELVSKFYKLDNATFINKNTGSEIMINGLTFFGILLILDSGLKFHLVDQVWLIMKSIFEQRTFYITENKKVKEVKNE